MYSFTIVFSITFLVQTQKVYTFYFIFISDIFTKTIRSDAQRQAQQNELNQGIQNTNFNIVLSDHSPATFFNDMQNILHQASLSPNDIKKDNLMNLFEEASIVIKEQTLTSNLYRTCGLTIVQLTQLLIAKRPDLIDNLYIETLLKILSTDRMIPFSKLPPKKPYSEETTPYAVPSNSSQVAPDEIKKILPVNYIFTNFISGSFILQLDQAQWDRSSSCLISFLKQLIDNDFLTIDFLSGMFLGLFKHEWNKSCLDKIQYISKNISEFKLNDSKLNVFDDVKSNLFIEFVTDLAKDLDVLDE